MKETNKMLACFQYKGQPYTLHERTNYHGDDTATARRFILSGDGAWMGEADTTIGAIKVLALRETRLESYKVEKEKPTTKTKGKKKSK